MTIRALIMTAAMALGVSLSAQGAINDWTSIGPTGGSIVEIAYDKTAPARVFATTGGCPWRVRH